MGKAMTSPFWDRWTAIFMKQPITAKPRPWVSDVADLIRDMIHEIATLKEVKPTEAMLNAARDWSHEKYGKPIGDDAAEGCWRAMFAASPLSASGAGPADKGGET